MARYVPAMRFGFLTRFYDPVVRLTSREETFKSRLVDQASGTALGGSRRHPERSRHS